MFAKSKNANLKNDFFYSQKTEKTSGSFQLIKDIQDIVERNNKSIIPIFIPKLLYYTTDWDTMAIFFSSRHYYATIDSKLVKLNGVEGFILQITVDKTE